MATHDVVLPSNKKVVFPSICVVCEKPHPDSHLELSLLGAKTEPILLQATGLALEGNTYGTNTNNEIKGIPACRGCLSGLKWYHRRLKFATYTAWLPGLLLMLALPLPTWLGVIILLAFVVAPPILSIIFPPAFGATFLNDKATFEFKSEKVANEFRQLNQAAG